MSVEAVTIFQDNITGRNGSDLLAVHSPLIFIADAEYSGSPPDYLYVHIYDVPGLVYLGSFKMIPYKDTSGTHRQFMFISDSILRGLMEDFPDFVQTGESFDIVEDITKPFYLVFSDSTIDEPDPEDIGLTIMALTGSRQFGDDPNAEEIYNNSLDTYYGAVNKPVYVYFYNDNAANVLTVVDHIHYTKTQNFTRNNCTPPEEGSIVAYTKIYTSYVSKVDLDAQVAADTVNYLIEGQAYANLNGTCSIIYLKDEQFDNWSAGLPVGWSKYNPSSIVVVNNSDRADITIDPDPGMTITALRYVDILDFGLYDSVKIIVKVDSTPESENFALIMQDHDSGTYNVHYLVTGLNEFIMVKGVNYQDGWDTIGIANYPIGSYPKNIIIDYITIQEL
jgi:hypothetical protein